MKRIIIYTLAGILVTLIVSVLYASAGGNNLSNITQPSVDEKKRIASENSVNEPTDVPDNNDMIANAVYSVVCCNRSWEDRLTLCMNYSRNEINFCEPGQEIRLRPYDKLDGVETNKCLFICWRLNQADYNLQGDFEYVRLDDEGMAKSIEDFKNAGLIVYSAKDDQNVYLIATVDEIKKAFGEGSPSYGNSWWEVVPARRPDIYDYLCQNGYEGQEDEESMWLWGLYQHPELFMNPYVTLELEIKDIRSLN